MNMSALSVFSFFGGIGYKSLVLILLDNAIAANLLRAQILSPNAEKWQFVSLSRHIAIVDVNRFGVAFL